MLGLEKQLKDIELAVEMNVPCLVIGETGIGKTTAIAHVAKQYGKTMHRVNLNGETGISELIGKYTLQEGSTKWTDGILIKAMKDGDWIVFDEINCALPEVLFCLNSLLDDARAVLITEKDNELVTAHPEFRFFASMNPSEEYAGTKELNKALLSRFTIVIHFERYSPEIEREIVHKHSPKLEENVAGLLVDIANKIRQLKDEQKIFYTCSLRDVIGFGKVLGANNHSIGEAFEITILNKVNKEERVVIEDSVKSLHSELGVSQRAKTPTLNKLLTANHAESLKKIKERDNRIKDLMKAVEQTLDKED